MMKRLTVNILALVFICIATNACAYEYVVKKGDSLSRIAKREYGNGNKWRIIYRANRAIIGRNPNKIRPGQRLVILKKEAMVKVVSTPKGYVYWKTITAVVKSYCNLECCCGKLADGRTAINDNAWVFDGAAVCFKAIPKRSMMFIPGIGWKDDKVDVA